MIKAQESIVCLELEEALGTKLCDIMDLALPREGTATIEFQKDFLEKLANQMLIKDNKKDYTSRPKFFYVGLDVD